MYGSDSDGLQAARAQLVSYSARLLDDGLAVGSAGNMSVRIGDRVAITPSGISYAEMRPEDICLVGMDGAELQSSETPSSETPMHLAIYAATRAGAVVHTHSPEVIALSAGRDELPAIHYAITGLGGPVRVAPYVRFGSAGLAASAVTALDGRSAVILRNHGAVCYGRDLAQAYDRALLLEWLARTYRLALITDPGYATYFGGPANVTAAKVSLINRVDQVYEDDLSIRMILVANNDLLNLNTWADATTPNGPCGAAACFTQSQVTGCSSTTRAAGPSSCRRCAATWSTRGTRHGPCRPCGSSAGRCTRGWPGSRRSCAGT